MYTSKYIFGTLRDDLHTFKKFLFDLKLNVDSKLTKNSMHFQIVEHF